MSEYQKWLYAFLDAKDGKPTACPRCGSRRVDTVIVRHADSDVGWGIVWCDGCRKGARISRMGVTDSDKYVSDDEMLQIVPEDVDLIY